jgi:small-conductance mechanosensitive channel
MVSQLLLSNRFKRIGWFLGGLSLLGLILLFYFDLDVFPFLAYHKTVWLGMDNDSFTDEILSIGFLFGMLFIAFGAESIEDERVSHRRLEAFQWAVLANSIILLVAIALIYDVTFLVVMEYNIFTTLLFFILRFHYTMWRDNQTVEA